MVAESTIARKRGPFHAARAFHRAPLGVWRSWLSLTVAKYLSPARRRRRSASVAPPSAADWLDPVDREGHGNARRVTHGDQVVAFDGVAEKGVRSDGNLTGVTINEQVGLVSV